MHRQITDFAAGAQACSMIVLNLVSGSVIVALQKEHAV